jgi:hypothetical protein
MAVQGPETSPSLDALGAKQWISLPLRKGQSVESVASNLFVCPNLTKKSSKIQSKRE